MKKNTRLISMVDHVLSMEENSGIWVNSAGSPYYQLYEDIVKYCNFLKKPLELGMFIGCDLLNNIMHKPNKIDYEIKANQKCSGWDYLDMNNTRYYDKKAFYYHLEKYQEAEERVLFKGFYAVSEEDYYIVRNDNHTKIWESWIKTKTIEDLVPLNLILTASAIKQIEGWKN